MNVVYNWLFPAIWIAYLVYWQIAAAGAKSTVRLEPALSRLFRIILFMAGIALLVLPRFPIPWLYRNFMPFSLWTFWVGAAVTVGGILFAVWARLTIGANWSRSVTIKQDHELITTGPYALVRHPIYTGLLTAFAGTTVAAAQYRDILAFVLIFLSLWYKLRLEEQWMRSQFGDSYSDYARHTAALVPWLL